MAGSYGHVVKDNGGLRGNKGVVDMLENGGDVFEAVEEMYGMIWWLANELSQCYPYNRQANVDGLPSIIKDAQDHYEEGLVLSPTKRYS